MMHLIHAYLFLFISFLGEAGGTAALLYSIFQSVVLSHEDLFTISYSPLPVLHLHPHEIEPDSGHEWRAPLLVHLGRLAYPGVCDFFGFGTGDHCHRLPKCISRISHDDRVAGNQPDLACSFLSVSI